MPTESAVLTYAGLVAVIAFVAVVAAGLFALSRGREISDLERAINRRRVPPRL